MRRGEARRGSPRCGNPWRTTALYAVTHPHSGVGDLGPLLTRVGKTLLSVPDEQVTATIDVTSWLDRKWSAILAHRSQLERERPLPGILSRLPEETRSRILGTEHYTRIDVSPSTAADTVADPNQLTPDWPYP
ncbi:hypothetical protein ACWC9R_24970 [Streptomyces sp. NPDC001219]